MRLLPVLLIILAVLPLSAAIKCHAGDGILMEVDGRRRRAVGDGLEQTIQGECPPESAVCEWGGYRQRIRGNKTIFERVLRNCGSADKRAGSCGAKKCEVANGTIPLTTCCCDGDLCNTADVPKLPGATVVEVDPPAPPVECYKGMETTLSGKIQEGEKEKSTCDSGYCLITEGTTATDAGKFVATVRDCLPDGTACKDSGKCGTVTEEGQPVTVCCCKDALCNDSVATAKGEKPPAPTPAPANPAAAPTLLLSLAAAAAMIAARI